MDIKEMARTMTREEFMKGIKFCEDGYGIEDFYGEGSLCDVCCPSVHGLINNCSNCKECWLNAIKDIKFKEEDETSMYNEDILKKVLEGAKNKIVVHYNSKEEFRKILELCEDRRIRWNMGEYIQVKNDLTIYYHCYENKYIKIEDNETTIGELNSYKGYEIIEYKDLLKIDYDKEYTIQELFDFEEETEFIQVTDIISMELVYKIEKGDLFLKKPYGWIKSSNSLKGILRMRFKLKKLDIDWSKVKVDTKILVRQSDEDDWKRRYFHSCRDGKVRTFISGATSFSDEFAGMEYDSIQWAQAKLYEEE